MNKILLHWCHIYSRVVHNIVEASHTRNRLPVSAYLFPFDVQAEKIAIGARKDLEDREREPETTFPAG